MNGWRAGVKVRVGALDLDVVLQGGNGSLALIGPNGSGKTTFLRLLAGAIKADHAEIVLDGQVLTSTRDGVEVPIERRRIGYVPQGYGLFPHLTVLENVAFGLSTGTRKLPRAQRYQRARAILEDLGCRGLADRWVSGLSGGEQQRIALARALVIEPALLLLDEPLAALDAAARRTVRGFLAERLQAFGRPTILVTHDVRDVIAFQAKVCVFERGRIVQTGSLDELRLAPSSDFVVEFIGSEIV